MIKMWRFDEIELVKIYLDNAIFNDSKNDLAFIIDDTFISLIEHQSTLSPNMPLRMLEYIAKEYHKMYFSNVIYSESRVNLPTPQFYVFYNGPKEAPLYQELKLSDSYAGECDKISLELKVDVINVNFEKDAELLERCRTLKEYSIFISRIRSNHLKYRDRDIAIRKSIDECIREGILSEYLKKHRGSVMSFLHVQLSQEEREAIREQDGVIKGEKKKAREIAMKMKSKEMPVDEIMEITELSREEIEGL